VRGACASGACQSVVQFNRRMDNWVTSDNVKEDPDAESRKKDPENTEKEDVRVEKRKRDDVSVC
jgi:hypothetical protein